ncbi:MAG: ACP phosphodiesterase [Rhodanobacter sp.]
MNHLAHALLAGDDEWLILGSVMGDFVHGPVDAIALPPRVLAGIRLHRVVDVFTDAHPEVLAAKASLPPPYRRYAGILLDMWFDHLLARDFPRWCTQSLDSYSDELRALLWRHDALLPAGLRRFRHYMEANDLPAGYAGLPTLDRALAGIGQRLSRANPLDSSLPLLVARDAVLQRHFEAFFPQLQDYASGWVARRGE